MSIDAISAGRLPERDFLRMRVTLMGMQAGRHPVPCRRVMYRLSLLNESGTSVRLLGRKWTLKDTAGNTRIIEGGKVFNACPVLTPGAVFSYGGYQEFTRPPVSVEVRFFGVDQSNTPFISPPLSFPRRALAGEA